MDDKDKIDPELEAEIRSAGSNVQSDSLEAQAKYLFSVYKSFRNAGFTRKRAYTLMVIHFQSVLGSL